MGGDLPSEGGLRPGESLSKGGSPSRGGLCPEGRSPYPLPPVKKQMLLKTLPSLAVCKNEGILEFMKFRNLGAKFVIRNWHEVYFCNVNVILQKNDDRDQ